MTLTPENSTLGKKTTYESNYDASKLFAIPRAPKRAEIGIHQEIPFYGFDIWNHYEVSWLNEKGKPIVAIAEIIYGCDAPCIIESKSMKLYFNSFNNTRFKDTASIENTVRQDLSQHIHSTLLSVRIIPLGEYHAEPLNTKLAGISLDNLDIECTDYHVNPDLLETKETWSNETLSSDLLKSNCLVTHQPDWCSIQITYEGKKINHESLLRYLISFRNDNAFHEQCIEKIFMHIMQRCQPKKLTVYGRSTRRGGLDINACRSTEPLSPDDVSRMRLCRQ